MSCQNILCNQGRSCTCQPTARRQRTCAELGVCQGRTPPCSGACASPPIVPHGLPVRPLGAEEPVDTTRLPPGGFWFAPGTIEEPVPDDSLSWLEVALIAMAGSGALGLVAGLAYGWWRGLL